MILYSTNLLSYLEIQDGAERNSYPKNKFRMYISGDYLILDLLDLPGTYDYKIHYTQVSSPGPFASVQLLYNYLLNNQWIYKIPAGGPPFVGTLGDLTNVDASVDTACPFATFYYTGASWKESCNLSNDDTGQFKILSQANLPTFTGTGTVYNTSKHSFRITDNLATLTTSKLGTCNLELNSGYDDDNSGLLRSVIAGGLNNYSGLLANASYNAVFGVVNTIQPGTNFFNNSVHGSLLNMGGVGSNMEYMYLGGFNSVYNGVLRYGISNGVNNNHSGGEYNLSLGNGNFVLNCFQNIQNGRQSTFINNSYFTGNTQNSTTSESTHIIHSGFSNSIQYSRYSIFSGTLINSLGVFGGENNYNYVFGSDITLSDLNNNNFIFNTNSSLIVAQNSSYNVFLSTTLAPTTIGGAFNTTIGGYGSYSDSLSQFSSVINSTQSTVISGYNSSIYNGTSVVSNTDTDSLFLNCKNITSNGNNDIVVLNIDTLSPTENNLVYIGTTQFKGGIQNKVSYETTTSRTVNRDEYIIICVNAGTTTITLPTLATDGQTFIVKRASGPVDVVAGGTLIDGVATKTLSVVNESITVVYSVSGGAYYII